MKKFFTVLGFGFGALLVVGCAKQSDTAVAHDEVAVQEPVVMEVVVALESKNDSGATGTAAFTQQDGAVLLHVELANTPAGEHAVHIHEFGDCSAPDGSSAGGHWNPMEMDHGAWADHAHHLGDIGNIVVGEDGTGTFHMTTTDWTIGSGEPNDISGKALIVHAGVDDFTTQPTGAAGGRIACGVIE